MTALPAHGRNVFLSSFFYSCFLMLIELYFLYGFIVQKFTMLFYSSAWSVGVQTAAHQKFPYSGTHFLQRALRINTEKLFFLLVNMRHAKQKNTAGFYSFTQQIFRNFFLCFVAAAPDNIRQMFKRQKVISIFFCIAV